ncbi:hypothetical protein L345_03698, partial [Ophiophagus hannah]
MVLPITANPCLQPLETFCGKYGKNFMNSGLTRTKKQEIPESEIWFFASSTYASDGNERQHIFIILAIRLKLGFLFPCFGNGCQMGVAKSLEQKGEVMRRKKIKIQFVNNINCDPPPCQFLSFSRNSTVDAQEFLHCEIIFATLKSEGVEIMYLHRANRDPSCCVLQSIYLPPRKSKIAANKQIMKNSVLQQLNDISIKVAVSTLYRKLSVAIRKLKLQQKLATIRMKITVFHFKPESKNTGGHFLVKAQFSQLVPPPLPFLFSVALFPFQCFALVDFESLLLFDLPIFSTKRKILVIWKNGVSLKKQVLMAFGFFSPI